jgi:N-acetylneuraminic acid mutarotase
MTRGAVPPNLLAGYGTPEGTARLLEREKCVNLEKDRFSKAFLNLICPFRDSMAGAPETISISGLFNVGLEFEKRKTKRMILRYLLLLLGLSLATVVMGQWEEMSRSAVTTRHHPVSFTLNDTAYLLTGTTAQSSPDGTADFFRYDEANDSWVRLPDFPGGARSFAYAASYNGKGYIGFGTNDYETFFNDLWEYDPSSKEWTELASCECRGRNHPVFVAQAGRIFVGLGNGPFDLNDFWSYDIDSNVWTQMPNLPGPPRHHPFHFAAAGKVYAGMGHSGSNYYADWYVFDPSTNIWTELNEHPGGGRVAGQEFSYDGYGYIISGDGTFHQNLVDGEFWKYLHETDEWERLPDHPGSAPDNRIGRWAPGSFVLNGYVYFFGGVNRGAGFLYNDMHRYQLEEETVSVNTPDRVQSTKVYPNPATDRLFVRWEAEPVHSSPYVLLTMAGRPVAEGKVSASGEIPLASKLPAGMYILSVGGDQHTVIVQP